MISPTEGRAGIVFDNDGLLLDTEPCWTRAQEQVFERRGRVFDLEAKQALVGTAPATATLALERLLELPAGQGAEASAEMFDLAVEEIAAGAEPRAGAVELLEGLRGRWPIAVASNAPRRHLLTGLTRVGLQDEFDVTLGIEDVDSAKPAPDLYLRACELLGVEPARSVAIEDSPPGVAAARAAGLFVIGVPSIRGISLEADRVFDSLADPLVPVTIEAALDADHGPEPPPRPHPHGARQKEHPSQGKGEVFPGGTSGGGGVAADRSLVGLDVGTTGVKAVAISPGARCWRAPSAATRSRRRSPAGPSRTPRTGGGRRRPRSPTSTSSRPRSGSRARCTGSSPSTSATASCARRSSGTTSAPRPSAPRSRSASGSSG